MKIGLLADVRGLLAPLEAALRILREERCDRLACLGSTVEGGAEDEAILARLSDEGALVVSTEHDAPGLLDGVPAAAELGGLRLTHATPVGSDDVLWVTGWPAPSLLRAMELLRGQQGGWACGDLYAPMAYTMGGQGARRRLFLGPGAWPVGDDPFLACPGSVALAAESRYGGSVMTWDDEARELGVVTFDADGGRRKPRRPVVLVYCANLGEHAPDEDALAGVSFHVHLHADDIVEDVERLQPDVILMDYHLTGRMSGMDAMIALRKGRDAMPAPVLAISGNPADSQGMKAAGAVGGLPHAYLKDVMTRMIREISD